MAKKKRAARAEPGLPVHQEAAPAAAGGPAGEAPKKDGKPKSALKSGADFIVMIAAAVGIALVIKAYAFDVYLIPSGSMETALHGRPDGGDRIFCSKLSYRFRGPERWEVAVFEFPYETARRSDPYHISEQYKGQNFVKRVVGLPGETLAIYRGDIWVRPAAASRNEFTRLVKPDSVQRGMWLNVYEEDFSDLAGRELDLFWRTAAGEAELPRGGPLRLLPGDGTARLDYRPLVPVGGETRQMVEMPGIPDRYTLRQPVQFRCTALLDGAVCGQTFMKTTQTQNMQARCPRCGTLQDESAAVFYHRRSGLPAAGRWAVSPRFAPQGEKVDPRSAEYFIVPDLRTVTEFTLADTDAAFSIILREDSRFVEAVVSGAGLAEIRRNGEPSRADQRMTAAVRPGKKHTLEFYVADGNARLFLDSVQLLDLPVWQEDRRGQSRSLPAASGVSLSAAGAPVTVESVRIDRDIYYYSGWEQERGEKFAHMTSQGEVFIGQDGFFPMGDHCTSSFDARSWGPVPLSLLRGPALLVWWPPERIGMIASP